MSGKANHRHRLAFSAVILVVLALAWLFPSRLAEHLLLNVLNDREAGLSCRSVEAKLSCLQLLREHRVERLCVRGIRLDLAKSLAKLPPELLTHKDLEFDLTVAADHSCRDSAMTLRLDGRALDWPLAAVGRIDVAMTNLVTVSGSLHLGPIDVAFDASPSEWQMQANMPMLDFSTDDEDLGRLIGRLPMGSVSNLVFSGGLVASASARKTREIPVTGWEAKLALTRARAAATIGANAYALDGLSLALAADGIADRVYLQPAMLKLKSAEFAGLAFTNAFAAVSREQNSVMVTEAGADCYGGRISLYALRLNPESLNAGFTLFIDDIDAGQALAHIPGFHGEASGRLHGKLPLFVRDGTKVRLRNAFLYSAPGETGSIKLTDSTAIMEKLRARGVSDESCENLSKALANLVYNVLKIRLTMEDRENAALTLKIDGSSTHGETTVPVTFEVTFHGALEQLFNLGLRTASMKGK